MSTAGLNDSEVDQDSIFDIKFYPFLQPLFLIIGEKYTRLFKYLRRSLSGRMLLHIYSPILIAEPWINPPLLAPNLISFKHRLSKLIQTPCSLAQEMCTIAGPATVSSFNCSTVVAVVEFVNAA